VAKFRGRADFGYWIPRPPTFLDTLEKQNLKRRQHLVGRPHFGLIGPGLCATSSPLVIFSMTMPYFGHIEDMHEFWSI
jgi:hypothetical protein